MACIHDYDKFYEAAENLTITDKLEPESVTDFHQEVASFLDSSDKPFFPNINRQDAVKILKNHGLQPFTYVVRMSSQGTFAVSAVSIDEQIHHFKIITATVPFASQLFSLEKNSSLQNEHFKIPKFPGIDLLLNYYSKNQIMSGIFLRTFITSEPLPLTCLSRSILHPFSKLSTIAISNLLENDRSINTEYLLRLLHVRDPTGRTIVHTLAKRNAVEKLKFLSHICQLNYNISDIEGNTPLQLAARENCIEMVDFLLSKSDPLMKNHMTGWTCIHEAAYNNRVEVLKVLICHSVPLAIYDFRNQTPLSLALTRNHAETIEILESTTPNQPKFKASSFLFQCLEHKVAENLLRQDYSAKQNDGIFLVRRSSPEKPDFTLSCLFNGYIYNYLISRRPPDHYFSIESGPLFESIEHLVDHYIKFADGLPGILRRPCNANVNTTLNPEGFRNFYESVADVKKLMQKRSILASSITRLNLIGKGAFGSVFEGIWRTETGTNVKVALKTLLNDGSEDRNLFVREAEVMMELEHPCIVRMFGIVNSEHGSLMMVLEMVRFEGTSSLLDFINRSNDLKPSDFKLWCSLICSGMMYLEQKGFIHRDLALRNILIAARDQIKISDFGLSRAINNEYGEYYRNQKGGKWPVKW